MKFKVYRPLLEEVIRKELDNRVFISQEGLYCQEDGTSLIPLQMQTIDFTEAETQEIVKDWLNLFYDNEIKLNIIRAKAYKEKSKESSNDELSDQEATEWLEIGFKLAEKSLKDPKSFLSKYKKLSQDQVCLK